MVTAPLLAVNNIEVIYDHVILVLRGVSLSVPEGGVVALLGANGAGKTTTLKAISNLLRAERGDVTKGSIEFAGEAIDRLSPPDVVRRGLIQVMEGRHCFAHLTVEENLLTGAFTRGHDRAGIAGDLEKVYAYFPRLRERRRSLAGYTSGGEQQMTVIGRAMMARPRMILLDEPSMGLAPLLVEEIFENRPSAESGDRCQLPGGGAEQQHGAALRKLRLRAGERSYRARRPSRGLADERGREGILSRARQRWAQELSRREALPPAQTLARLTREVAR